MRCLLIFLLVQVSTSVIAQQVDRVEPPNWWVGMRHSKVQLMIYGKRLDGVNFRCADDRLRVVAIHSTGNPNYAFIDLLVPQDLEPGSYKITYGGDDAEKSFSFSVLSREDGKNRHQGFGPEDVIYLITPDRFANGEGANDQVDGMLDDFNPTDPASRHGGDLRGVINRLDYLKDLGVTAIWLNPVLENNGINSYHGYKATNLYRIDPRLGTNDTYRELVAEAHRHGIKVIFDHVNNHIGIRHPWLNDLPAKDWLNGTQADHSRDKHYLMSISDPHADADSEQMLKSFWFVDRMPDLNQRNPLLANYLIQNSLWWIEFSGIDGIREDTYPYADQRFLARWAKAIRGEYPRFNIVGEIWGVNPAYVAQFQQETILPRDFETNLPAVMDFPLNRAMREFVEKKAKLRDVYEVYAQDFLYTDLNNLLVFVDNHDAARAIYLADGDDRRVRVALTILLFARGIPQILYGTEINMMGGPRHVDLRADFPGGFSGAKRDAFTADGRTAEEDEMFNYLRTLLHLRKKYPALSRGNMVHYPPTWNSDVYKILKVQGNEKILIIANGHEETRNVDMSDLRKHLTGVQRLRDLVSGDEIRWGDGIEIKVPATSCAVYVLQ